MSHEIRTPITAVQGFADLLLDDDLTAEQRVEFIETSRRNSRHLPCVMNDILDMSKPDAPAPDPAELRAGPSSIDKAMRAASVHLTWTCSTPRLQREVIKFVAVRRN